MNQDGQNSKFITSNEDLGLFLPNSIIPEIINDYDFQPQKNLMKYCFGGVESPECDLTSEDTTYTHSEISYYKQNSLNSKQGLFNPRAKCYSHQEVGDYFTNHNFGGQKPNQMANFNFPNWNNNLNNKMKMNSFNQNNHYSNNSNIANNFKNNPPMTFQRMGSFNPRLNTKNSINHNLYENEINHISHDNYFSNGSNPMMQSLENSMCSINLQNPKKKNYSTDVIGINNGQKLKNHFKKYSIPQKKNHQEEDELESFIENLDCELHSYICSQKGSRIMQKFLNKITPERFNLFINKIGYNIPRLMIDLYGNYFCQKLAQSCSAEQRILILNYISNEIVNISYDNSGTHALQSLLEIINLPDEEIIILNSIKNFELDMCYDNNATHVIQKIIVCFCEERREFLNKLIIENLKNLCLDSNGICVVKKLINTNKSDSLKSKVIDEIHNNCLEIVQSPFGNYAIQHLLEEWGILNCKSVIKVIQMNIVSLSMQKYSSNVVERCLEMSDRETQRSMISEIISPCKLLSLLKNKYGSFVLQKAINYLTQEERTEKKILLQNKINITSSKEKSRINAFFELLS